MSWALLDQTWAKPWLAVSSVLFEFMKSVFDQVVGLQSKWKCLHFEMANGRFDRNGLWPNCLIVWRQICFVVVSDSFEIPAKGSLISQRSTEKNLMTRMALQCSFCRKFIWRCQQIIIMPECRRATIYSQHCRVRRYKTNEYLRCTNLCSKHRLNQNGS